MARIVCLANSYKGGDRCIAGIDLDTEKRDTHLWYRLITYFWISRPRRRL